jgi:hypothetical protein
MEDTKINTPALPKWIEPHMPTPQYLTISAFLDNPVPWNPAFDSLIHPDVKAHLLNPDLPIPSVIHSHTDVKLDSLRAAALSIATTASFRVRCIFSHAWITRFKRLPHRGILMIPEQLLCDGSRLSQFYAGTIISKTCRQDTPQTLHDVWTSARPQLIMTCLAYQYSRDPATIIGHSTERMLLDICQCLAYFPCPQPFPVAIAVDSIRRSKATRVLDIAAGYGDRLIAACLAGVEYVSADPTLALQPVYKKIVTDLGCPGLQYEAFPCPFEDLDLVGQIPFDLLLSSPPFFDLELYDNQADTQSTSRYPTLDEWLQGYLWASLTKSNAVLAPNATIVLHLCDVWNSRTAFVERTLTFMETTLKWKLIGYYGYTKKAQSTRGVMGMSTLTSGEIKCQPLFVLKKPNN